MSETNPLSSLSPEQLQRLREILNSPKVNVERRGECIDEYGYIVTLVEYNLEAFISWREAQSLEEAIEHATHDSNTRWHSSLEIPRDKVVGRYITRNEWCDWVRS